MMFADVVFSTESLAIIGLLMGALSGALVFVFKLLMAAKDQHIITVSTERDAYKDMAKLGATNLTLVAATIGKPVPPLAPVVGEHQSPMTERQKEMAEMQTVRAELTAAVLALNLPAREEADPPAATGHAAKIVKSVKAVEAMNEALDEQEPPKE